MSEPTMLLMGGRRFRDAVRRGTLLLQHVLVLVLAVASVAAPCAHADVSLKADLVRVIKSQFRLFLVHDGEVFATYPVVLGGNPVGHKQRAGDERTPEGRYFLIFKNPDSDFHKSILLSYPNARDVARARERGVDPGGLIMIHGQANGSPLGKTRNDNWTDGCIALSDEDMDAVWDAVDVNVPIFIEP